MTNEMREFGVFIAFNVFAVTYVAMVSASVTTWCLREVVSAMRWRRIRARRAMERAG